MNKRLTFRTIGTVLLVESALMMAPLVVSLIYGSDDSARSARFRAADGVRGRRAYASASAQRKTCARARALQSSR